MSDLGQWLALILAMAGPVAIVALVTRRWLWQAMIGWVLSPLVVFAMMALVELATKSSTDYPPGTLLFGLMLIASVTALPWLAFCAFGFTLGWALRSRQPPLRSMPSPVRQPLAAASEPVSIAVVAEIPAIPELAPVPHVLDASEIADAPTAPAIVAPLLRESHESQTANDGTIRIDFEAVEWGNTRWVRSPRIIDLARNRTVLDLWGSDWDATASFPAPRTIALELRRFQKGGSASITLDLANDVYRMSRGPAGKSAPEEGPLSGALDAITRAAQRRAAREMLKSRMEPRQKAPVTARFAAWRTALIILVGAGVAIAVLTVLSTRRAEQLRGQAPLATVPPPPQLPSRR